MSLVSPVSGASATERGCRLLQYGSGKATLTIGALTLKDVSAVGAIDRPAPATPYLEDALAEFFPTSSGVADRYLSVAIHVARVRWLLLFHGRQYTRGAHRARPKDKRQEGA